MMGITVLKIGGSIITDKSSPTPRALTGEIQRIAREISGGTDPLVVVHGAGSFGHPLARKYELTEKYDPRGVIETHRCVRALNTLVVDALNSEGVDAVPVQPLGTFVLDKGRISTMCMDPILEMLKRGLVPVLHGDVAMDTSLGATILSGDQIVPYIAQRLNAARIGVGSNTEGVLDGNGHLVPVITPATFNTIRGHIGASAHTDVTGGMLGKVRELVNLADATGIESRIFNAGVPGNVREFMKGAAIGTLIQKII